MATNDVVLLDTWYTFELRCTSFEQVLSEKALRSFSSWLPGVAMQP